MATVTRSLANRFSGPAIAGLAMIYAAVAMLFYMIYSYKTFIEPIAAMGVNKEGVVVSSTALTSVVLIPVSLVVFCLFTFLMGYKLVASSGIATVAVLPNQDRELLTGLIKDGQDLGVRLYLDLINTKGVTGNFTKLGITGLPLATIFLTCFFSIMGLSGSANQNTFLDLAKLTLGAFIGSFVQRQAERERKQRTERTSDQTSKISNSSDNINALDSSNQATSDAASRSAADNTTESTKSNRQIDLPQRSVDKGNDQETTPNNTLTSGEAI